MYTPGFVGHAGLEKSVKHLVHGLSERGHECKVLVMREREHQHYEEQLGPNVIVCGDASERATHRGDPLIDAILDLQHTLSVLPAVDVLLALAPICTGAARAAVQMMDDRPAIISRISGAIGKVEYFDQLMYADAHLAVNSGIAEKIIELDAHAVVETIYQPADGHPPPAVPRADIPTFIYIGRMFNLQKRIDVMFRALAAVPNKRWKLKLIEDAAPEPKSSDEIRMRDLAIKLGIADRIVWIGYRDHPWDEVTEATALILPSDWEAYCDVLIEALARGIPVISSDCPSGPRDIVQHGQNGWLFKPGDVLGLAGMISRIMSGSLPLPEAETCRKSVAHFDQDLVLDQIEQAMQSFADKQLPYIS